MGVKGLLSCLESITRSVSLERYRGLAVAIDAMSWLHKGIFACDVKTLARSQRRNSNDGDSAESKCVQYAVEKAQYLKFQYGMDVLLVIDGDTLPSKKEENARRQTEKDEAFEKALVAEKSGDGRAARRYYAKSCSVTNKAKYELIKACKQAKLAYLVAPYEADAQMARLSHTGVVDLVLTEDSDILAYGCPRALFKVDFDTCRGREIQLMRYLAENESPSFHNWTHDMFVFMCILSGCDYCKGIPGIGIKLAHKVVRVHRNPSKIFNALRAAGRMPEHFEEKFWIAFRTFRHQRVFCPSTQKVEPLFPIDCSINTVQSKEMWPFLGEYVESHIACRIADGTLNPSNKMEWSASFKEEINDESLRSGLDAHTNRRFFTGNDSEQRNKTQQQKEKIRHCTVYGVGGEEQQHGMKGADEGGSRSSVHCAPVNNMFEFFSQKNKCGIETGHAHHNKLPMYEVCSDDDSHHRIKTSNYITSSCHKDIPIHFQEYSSQLVSKTFIPLSRKRKKREGDGSKSSKFVQEIWRKSFTNESNDTSKEEIEGRQIRTSNDSSTNVATKPIHSHWDTHSMLDDNNILLDLRESSLVNHHPEAYAATFPSTQCYNRYQELCKCSNPFETGYNAIGLCDDYNRKIEQDNFTSEKDFHENHLLPQVVELCNFNVNEHGERQKNMLESINSFCCIHETRNLEMSGITSNRIDSVPYEGSGIYQSSEFLDGVEQHDTYDFYQSADINKVENTLSSFIHIYETLSIPGKIDTIRDDTVFDDELLATFEVIQQL